MSLSPPQCPVRPWSIHGQSLGGQVLVNGHLQSKTLLMAIINCTPDSFFDGGKYTQWDALRLRYEECVKYQVDILDLGAESSRPGAPEVSAEEEWSRLEPVFEFLREQDNQIPISIDTTKASVAARALEAGASIINDISALQMDPAMPQLVADTGCSVVLNHMQGTPRTMQSAPHYLDVVKDVTQELGVQIQQLLDLGVDQSKICVDPGIGFGKDLNHNMQLIWNLSELDRLGCPIMMGMSRKSFIGKTPGLEESDRLIPSVSSGLIAAMAGASILRVHDIKETKESLAMLEEMRHRGIK